MIRTSEGLGRSIIIAAAVVVVLAGITAASSLLGWILLSLLFAILCYPVYAWLTRLGLPAGISLAVIGLILIVVVVVLAAIVAGSIAQLVSELPTYQAQIAERVNGIVGWLQGRGVKVPEDGLSGVVNTGAVMRWSVELLSAISMTGFTFINIVLTLLFLVVDGPKMVARMRAGLGEEYPLVVRLTTVSPKVVRYFGVRAYVNLLTGAGATVAYILLGVPYAVLWGVLLFFMSFVPYLGIFVASVPPVLLAFALHGLGAALLVIACITLVNFTVENLVMPRLVGTSLRMAPSVVFISFFFWTWLLGPSGALLAAFLTVLVIVLLDSYERTQWLANLMSGAELEPAEVAAVSTAPEAVVPDASAPA